MDHYSEAVIIHTSMRHEILGQHECHLGKKKSHARPTAIMYWPSVFDEIIEMIVRCQTCNGYHRVNQQESLLPQTLPNGKSECMVGTIKQVLRKTQEEGCMVWVFCDCSEFDSARST